jgi:hypothetical protein
VRVVIAEDFRKHRIIQESDGNVAIFIRGKWYDVDLKRHGLIERQPDYNYCNG